MTDLLSQLERATEGSRDLSDRLLCVLGWRLVNEDNWRQPDGSLCLAPQRPDPTTNLQDAVSLLTDGAEYEITTIYGVAQVTLPLNSNDDFGPWMARREDGNVCLAFCEAIIKANVSKAEAA